jgi:hypothetical protein
MSTTSWAAQDGPTGRGITLNGQPFFACGVAYAPVPWGGDPNWPPFGDFMFPPWNGIWTRDLPLMRAAGINVIRTYNIENVSPNPPYATQDHTAFFEACWNGGVDPIYVLVGYGPLNTVAIYDPWNDNPSNPSRDQIQTSFLNMVTAYGGFPAVMGFIIGNEVNNSDTIQDANFWAFLDNLASATKQAAPGKLTVLALVDDSMASVQAGDSQIPNLDVWGINSYRGQINPSNANNFNNLWSSFAQASNKPLLLTEWGAPASTHSGSNLVFTGQIVADLNTYITGHYADIQFNGAATTSNGGSANPNAGNWAAVCVGSCYFEWTDEWWKMDDYYPQDLCPATLQEAGVSQNAAFPGGWDDEECFGLNAIAPSTPPTPATARPGPTSGSCAGPWDFAANAPYAPDILTARSSLATLSGLFLASQTAQGMAVMEAGVVLQVVVTNPGGSYASAPTVTITPPTNGMTAQAVATISPGGSVTAVTMTSQGSGYDFGPQVTFSPPP